MKILGTPNTVMCEVMNCQQSAKFLFRMGLGPISALCSDHAEELAAERRIDLPDPFERTDRSWRGWCDPV